MNSNNDPAREPNSDGPNSDGLSQNDRTVIAGMFEHEWEASLMRETLLAAGIPCTVAGGLTGSFRAEAPGRVKLLVREHDLERAKLALEARRDEVSRIDWNDVDVDAGETGDR
ncbi:MAG: DUF2007 domain-containing protein [Phycisphaerae bacterium]|nr:DUF2007 domain-containing protein [Phycisphaerae bacterium]